MPDSWMSENVPVDPAGPAARDTSPETIRPPGPEPVPAIELKSSPCSDANFLASGLANSRPDGEVARGVAVTGVGTGAYLA